MNNRKSWDNAASRVSGDGCILFQESFFWDIDVSTVLALESNKMTSIKKNIRIETIL